MRRFGLGVILACALGATACGGGQGGSISPTSEVAWRGHPVGLALFETTIAIADTRDDIVAVERNGTTIGRVPALSDAFDTAGSGGDLLTFSSDGRELAWIEYPGGSAVLRVLSVPDQRIRDVPVDLPAPPRVAQLLWNDGYHVVSESGARRLVTGAGDVAHGDALAPGGRVVFADGAEWRLERGVGGLALFGPGDASPTLLAIPGAVMDAEASGGRLAVITTGLGGMGDARVPKLFLIDLRDDPEIVLAVPFRQSSEGPYRLAWTGSDLLVLMAEGEVRGYDVSTGDLRYTVEVGAPNAAGLAVSDGTLLVRTAEDVRRLRLPGT